MCLLLKIKRLPFVCLLGFAIILLVLFFSINFCYASESDKALKYYGEGLKLFNAGQYEKAVEAFKEAIRIKPDYVDAYESLGFAFYKLNQYEKEIESYQKILKFKPDYAKAHYSLGIAFLSLKQYEKAIDSFKESIRLEPGNAGVYSLLGHAHNGLNQYEKSIEAFKEVVRLKPEDADAYYHLGLTYTLMKQYEKAIEVFKEAIKLKPDDAEIHGNLGLTYSLLNKHEQAVEAFKQAIEAFNEALKVNPLTDQEYFILGNSYHAIGHCEKAIDAYREALKLKPDSAEIYTRLGQALLGLGQDEEALESHKKAIKINPDYAEGHHQLGLYYGLHGKFADSIYHLILALNLHKNFSDRNGEADVLLELARIYLSQGKDINAMNYLQDALKIYQEAQNLEGEGNVLLEISNVYAQIRDYNTALEFQKRASAILQKLGDTYSIVLAFSSLAATKFYIEQNSSKNYEEPNNYINQAIELSEKTGKDYYLSFLYKLKGDIYLENKDYDNAMKYGKKILKLAEKEKDKYSNALAFSFMGQLYANLENYQQALDYCQKAIDLLNEIGEIEWDIFGKLGHINDKLGNITAAKSNYLRAINIFESNRENIQSLSLKMSLAINATGVYTDAILFLLKTNEHDEAFNYTERAKARTFLDLLGSRFKLQDKEIFEEERRLQFRINYLTEKIREAHEKPDKNASPLMETALEKQLNEARKEYAELLEKIKKENPELSTLLTINPFTLKEVQNLLDSDITLLEYFITPYKTLLWVVGKSDLKVIEIAIKDKELTKKVDAFREKIAHLESDYKKDADELYDLLIKPAKPYIKTNKIGIIPHSVLHYLPFQALLNNENRFLIEEYEIFYSPSASVLKFVYEKRKMISDKVLAFGNPDIGDEKLNLPYAEDEVKKIKDTYPDTALYLKDKATEERAKSLSGDYNIIHFASHGELNPMNPMFSSIRLAKDKEEDGRLEVAVSSLFCKFSSGLYSQRFS